MRIVYPRALTSNLLHFFGTSSAGYPLGSSSHASSLPVKDSTQFIFPPLFSPGAYVSS